MIRSIDLSEPYTEHGKWYVDEQLYPECRVYNSHVFETEIKAKQFIANVKLEEHSAAGQRRQNKNQNDLFTIRRERHMDDKFEKIIPSPGVRTFPFDSDVKEKFNAYRKAGEFVKCPCCEKSYNVIYKRQIYKSLAKGLRELNKGSRSVTIASISDFAKLRFWGLVLLRESKGEYKITQLGIDFLKGERSVPKYILLQNNIKIGESDKKVHIWEID